MQQETRDKGRKENIKEKKRITMKVKKNLKKKKENKELYR
jgi:hypothetical protein